MNRSYRFRNNNKPASIMIRSDKFTSTASNIEQKEKLDDLVRRENEFLEEVRNFSKKAEVLKSGQATVVKGRKSIEDRMIGILSFATSIELYRRFLEERSMYATGQLAEQISDLDYLQQFVEMTEKSVLKCNEMLGADLNDEIEAQNFEEQLELETLETQNASRRIILDLQMQLSKKPEFPSKEKLLKIKRIPQKDAFPTEEQILYAQLEIKKSEELVKKASQRQQLLNQEHFQLEQIESDFNTKVQNMTEKYKMKKEKMKNLRTKLSEIERLRININSLNEQNARLRTELCNVSDRCAEPRRYHSHNLKLQEQLDLAKYELINIQTRYNDRLNYAKKRRHQYHKDLKMKAALEEEIQKLDEECQNKINEVMEIERQEHEAEVNLNKKLKEIQEILTASDQEATFDDRCSPVSQEEELQKIISLVSNNENVNLN